MTQARAGEADSEVTEQLKLLREKFEAAMDDDLNTSVAISVMFELVRLATTLLDKNEITIETLNEIDVLFSRLGGDVLGLVMDEYPRAVSADADMLDKLVNVFIEQRRNARQREDFIAADALRKKLEEIGIILEDKPAGVTAWRRK
jgi:cysteinyl-tRNA synthetase